MVYTRSNETPTILDRVDMDLVMLSPTDQQDVLKGFIDNLNYTADKGVIYEPQEIMFGYEEPDGEYYTEWNTDRIALWYSATDKANGVTALTWYDNEDNQLIEDISGVSGDSIIFAYVPTYQTHGFVATRVVYGGKIIYSNCPKVQSDPIKVYFFDEYGLPQCISVNKVSYALKYDTLGNYRSYNNGLKYEYHKQANYTVTIGDDGYEKIMIPFLNGFTLSEAYMAEYNDTIIDCSLTEVNSGVEKKGTQVSITGTLEVHPTNAQLLEPQYLQN